LDEGEEAADGEEITNKFPGLKQAQRRIDYRAHEMCAIHADFKHFRGAR
jgi:hypothetical protein